MGVLNVTPDSFSDGGKYFSIEDACRRALQMQKEGADIIDIGGESTRPNAAPVLGEEEIRRVIPVLKKFLPKARIPVSIDTSHSETAKYALKAGASIINDITGLLRDKQMASVIAEYKAAVVIMHIKGRPQTMQKAPRYKNLLVEIKASLMAGINTAIKAGIDKRSIVIDPGIGFGKTVRHNLKILNKIAEFKKSGYPVLIGLSRKSFMGKILGLNANERLIPTVACNAVAIANGADIIRVHDIKEAVWTKDIVSEIVKS
jgi:dihydropteroate synthase